MFTVLDFCVWVFFFLRWSGLMVSALASELSGLGKFCSNLGRDLHASDL